MRTVRNVHTRTVQAPASVVGALLDRLGGDPDPLFPTPAWHPMRLDRPLEVGAVGDHGLGPYRVTVHEPGRRIRFAFPPGPDGDDTGYHEFTVHPLGSDRCRVDHVLEVRRAFARRLVWHLAIRAGHDTVVEETLDNVERAATGQLRASVRWSARVRLLNRLLWDRPTAVDLPEGARLARRAFPRTDFQDAWQLPLRPGMPTEPEAWEGVLRGAPFPVVGREGGEILLGKDAGHLDFRASILVADGRVTLGTVVRTHHRGGRLYLALVRRVHPFMARTMLRRTHRRLALAAPGAGERWAARPPVGR
ncbi:hypothetical protein GCM10010211_44920 [Streptomyces albospinus]|uniref:DUF2867 domain-containing protein n=1 Tax=Streptomyces albospinus TaxID=285515 RepID=A0ABQ2V8C5_9ACTN|nr:DUF2867 domain-containing protein [Streptomyces albospinus]GGU74086.1 hypothetical protein GCM10010211_44920 [Streptomyces albospinus]